MKGLARCRGTSWGTRVLLMQWLLMWLKWLLNKRWPQRLLMDHGCCWRGDCNCCWRGDCWSGNCNGCWSGDCSGCWHGDCSVSLTGLITSCLAAFGFLGDFLEETGSLNGSSGASGSLFFFNGNRSSLSGCTFLWWMKWISNGTK